MSRVSLPVWIVWIVVLIGCIIGLRNIKTDSSMKQIYLGETIQLIAETQGIEIANELVESGELRFITRGDERYPYLVIESNTESKSEI